MKKIIVFTIVAFFLVGASVFLLQKDRIAMAVVKRTLKETFPRSKIDVAAIKVRPFSSVTIQGLRIRYPLQPDTIFLKEVAIAYSLPRLVRGVVDAVSVKGLDIALENMIKIKSGKPLVVINKLNVEATVRFKDMELNAISAQVVRDARGGMQASVVAQKGKAKDLIFGKVAVDVAYAADTVDVTRASIDLFGSSIVAQGKAALKPQVAYEFTVKGNGVNLARVIEDLKLKEKVDMSGLCDLDVVVSGTQTSLPQFSGKIIAESGGGKFIIYDKQSLENVSAASGLPMDVVMESLKNYRYNTGGAEISMDGNNVMFHVIMDGEQGSRDIMIVLHDGLKIW